MMEIAEYHKKQDIVEYAQAQIMPYKTLEELKEVDEKAMALHEYAKSSRKPIEVWNAMIAVAAHARRKAGALLGPEGVVRAGRGDHKSPSVGDLGLDDHEINRWTALARIPEEPWNTYHRETKIITFTGLYNLARKLTKPGTIEGLYDVIVIDPPWPIERIQRDVRPNQEKEVVYPVMTIQEIMDIELPAKEDCHIFLWATQRFLPSAFHVLTSWDVEYICTFAWHKTGGYQPIGLPQYNWEPVLYARKGKPIFADTKNFNLCFNAKRGEHSEKPQEFYETISRVTAGDRIDMFGRRNIEGFTSWGNEV